MTSNLLNYPDPDPDGRIDIHRAVREGRTRRRRRHAIAGVTATAAIALLVVGGLAVTRPDQQAGIAPATQASRSTARTIVPAGQPIDLGGGVTFSVTGTKACLAGLDAAANGVTSFCAQVDDGYHGGPLTPERLAGQNRPFYDFEAGVGGGRVVMGVVGGEPARVTYTGRGGDVRDMMLVAYPGQQDWTAYYVKIPLDEIGQPNATTDPYITTYDAQGTELARNENLSDPGGPVSAAALPARPAPTGS